ncbi:MAG: cation diffusion facilitator family transporter [Spirochaetales bacterium]|uniref:Cation diffusion facilitator family transporter n=1 Tax=Candidatus Thalassospirochaeta sargassi TaxID=3119039 RepID=A0AAJ1MIB5_9SPIO|nr:cation diffusion facilitator family transporter [Spirochaetales bacterium]
MKTSDRTRKIKRASWAGITGNGILAVLKIWFGTVGGSASLVGAGIDTATDIVSSIVTLFTADIADKPPDKEHPYGHGRAEAIAAKILSFIIIMAGVQLLISTVTGFFSGEEKSMPAVYAVYISAGAIVAKFVLFVYKMRIGREVNSQMVIADAENMKADIVLSSSVLAGLLVTVFANLPIIDSIMAIGVGLWILRNGISIFMESNDELMEGAGDNEIYSKVFEALKRVDEISNPHRVRIRKINTMYVIDLDIEVDGNLTVYEGHELSKRAEKELRSSIDNLYDVIVHLEPGGNFEDQERYGLTEESLD